MIGTAGYNITRECMLPKQDIKPPGPCRLYKLQLDYYKLIYIKEEKHPYTYTRLQITGIYFEKQQFVFFYNTFILFHWGIHSYITSMIHCTDSYKLMSITFWKHCRFSSISLKTRTVRAWSAEDGFSDYQATSQQRFCFNRVYNNKEIDGTSISCSSFHVECNKYLN